MAQLGTTVRQATVRFISSASRRPTLVAASAGPLPPPNATDEQLLEFLTKRMYVKPNDLMSSRQLTPYEPDAGVDILVDGLMNLSPSVIVQAVVYLHPFSGKVRLNVECVH